MENINNQKVNNQILKLISNIESFKYPNHEIVNVRNLNVWVQKDLSVTPALSSSFEGEGMFAYKVDDGEISERFRFSGCVELNGTEVVSVKTPPFTLYKK